LQPGERVGSWQVEGLLSTVGGEGQIYTCSRDGQTAVLKYYFAPKSDTEVIEKVKAVRNPHIISILDYGDYQGRFYTVLEYAQGGALDDRGDDGSYKYLPISEEDAPDIVAQVIDAFNACHRAGIIHRDIKPGNLFYRTVATLPGGKLKGEGILVGDFGIASLFDAEAGMSKHLTKTGARTEGYAPPEALGGRLGIESIIGKEYDYYSLGVTLWVLLTGKEPFVDENGRAKQAGQIINETTQGKTALILLARSPNLSASMKKLIRGLLTVRHDKRWGYDEVRRHLAGDKNVDVVTETQALPPVDIGGDICTSYKEIAEAILRHPEEGKQYVFKNLANDLVKVDPKFSAQVAEVIDDFSKQGRIDEGAVFAACRLCPNLAFPLDHGLSIMPEAEKALSLKDVFKILESDEDAILPYLRDPKRGFYAYLEASGLGDHARKIKEVVNASSENKLRRDSFRAVPRIIAAFQLDEGIRPFQDGVHNEDTLRGLDDLHTLPDHLKARTLIFIERNYGILPAWLEIVSGKDLDDWLTLVRDQRDFIDKQDKWQYFSKFIAANDAEFYDFYIEELKRDPAAALKGAAYLKKRGKTVHLNRLIDYFWQDLFQRNLWEAARTWLLLIDKARLEGLSNPWSFYQAQIGITYWEESAQNKAVKYLQEAWALNRKGCDAAGDPYALYLGVDYMRRKKYADAVPLFMDAVTAQPDNSIAWFYKAACHLKTKQYTDAISCCDTVLNSNTADSVLGGKVKARVYSIRSLAYRHEGNIPKAESDEVMARAQ
jgi:serine/threonine protein kinase